MNRCTVAGWDIERLTDEPTGKTENEIEIVVYAPTEDEAIMKASLVAQREFYELVRSEEVIMDEPKEGPA